MLTIPVYKQEAVDGLADMVRSSGAVAYTVPLGNPIVPKSLSASALTRLKDLCPDRAKASEGDFDLHPLQTILVSVDWNKNDDVFDPLEVWSARHTPAHKPFNYEHDCAQIIGHMTDDWVVDDNGNLVPDDTTADNLPAKFHLATAAVLYKTWDKPELQERMDKLLDEIAKGEWFVSMECLFRGFDYALKSPDGSMRTVARNSETAYLTKYLRQYGGTGTYDNYRVGRVLRNVHFSGKGLVKDPANPQSVILESATSSEKISGVPEHEVYSPVVNEHRTESKGTMTVTIESLQAANANLLAEIEKLKANQQEVVVAEYKTKLEKAEADKKQADELLQAAQEALTKSNESSVAAAEKAKADMLALTTKAEAAEKELEAVKAELKKLHDAQVKANRILAIKDKLKLDTEAATAFAESVELLTDDLFTKQVELLAKAMAPKTEAPKTETKVEDDKAGEAAAAAANLASAQASTETSGAVSDQNDEDGVTEVQKAIAAYFDRDENQDADNDE